MSEENLKVGSGSADETVEVGGIEIDRNPQTGTAIIVGGVLVFVGILGFVLVPGEGKLLGIFGVNPLHNLVHIATGLFGLGAGLLAGSRTAAAYNVSHALLYMVVFLLGVFTVVVLDLLNANTADNFLHFLIAAILGLIGITVRP